MVKRDIILSMILIFSFFGCRQSKLPVIVYKDDPNLPVKLVLNERLGFIIGIAYSPDGKYIACSNSVGKTKIIHVKLGRIMKEFDLSSKDLAFTPDGQILKIGLSFFNVVTGKLWKKIDADKKAFSAMDWKGGNVVIGEKKCIKVINLKKNKVMLKISKKGPHEVRTVAISRDGRYIAADWDEYSYRIWNTKTGKLVTEILARYSTNIITFSPDGEYVIIIKTPHGFKYMLEKRRTKTGELVKTIDVSSISKIYKLYLCSDNETLITRSDGLITFWDFKSGKIVKKIFFDPKMGLLVYKSFPLAVSPNEETLMSYWPSIYRKNSLSEISIKKMIVVRKSFPQLSFIVHFLYKSKDGKYAAVKSYNGSIVLIDVLNGKVLWTKKANLRLKTWAIISPDNKYVVNIAKKLLIHDLENGRIIFTFENRRNNYMSQRFGYIDMAFSPDSKYLALSCSNREIKIIDMSKLIIIKTILIDVPASSLVFSPDGKTLACAGYYCYRNQRGGYIEEKKILFYDFKTGRKIAEFNTRGEVKRILYTPDGSNVVATDSDCLFYTCLFSTKPYALKKILPVNVLAVNSNFDMLVISARGNEIIDYKTSKTIKVFKKAWFKHDSIAGFFCKDKMLIGYSHNVRFWNLKTGKQLTMIIYPDGEWFIRDDKGRFDYSKGAGKHIHYVRGMKSIPLGSYKNKLYKPGLYRSVMDN